MAILIAECATTHGGDLQIAEDLIHAARDAGADYAKFQSYSLAKLNPADPQADWLRQAHLDRAAHERLIACCDKAGVKFLSTPFDAESLQMLRELGRTTFKMASSESHNAWWQPQSHERWFVSYPWGRHEPAAWSYGILQMTLTAIPLYPTPLECVGQATLLDGWSDHCVGLDACYYALARGATVIEAHLTLGPGKSRVMPFDKMPGEFLKLRTFADSMQTIETGVSETFRKRWSA